MNSDEIRKQAKHGFVANAVRQIVVQSVGVVSAVVLARYLSPSEFGVFGALLLTTHILTVSAEVGLGFALVRQVEDPSPAELETAFWVQMALVTGICGGLLTGGPWLIERIAGGLSAPALVPALFLLAVVTWLTSTRFVPNVFLQRRLGFASLAGVELAENIAYHVCAIILALYGFGVWALLYATLARAVVGTVLVFWLAPWSPAGRWQTRGLKETIVIGFGFQSLSLVGFLKDLVMPALISTQLGITSLGYFTWARDLGLKLATISRLYGRVAFPTFARLGTDLPATRSFLTRSVHLLGLFYWPATTAFVATTTLLVSFLFGERWLPALAFLIPYVLTIALQIWAAPTFALVQARSSGGWAVRTMVIVAGLELALLLPAIRWFGLWGAGAIAFTGSFAFLIFLLKETRAYLDWTLGQEFVARIIINGGLLIVIWILLPAAVPSHHEVFLFALVGLSALAANCLLRPQDRAFVFSLRKQLADL